MSESSADTTPAPNAEEAKEGRLTRIRIALYRHRLLIMIVTLVSVLFGLFNGFLMSSRVADAAQAARDAKASAEAAQESADKLQKQFLKFDESLNPRLAAMGASIAEQVTNDVAKKIDTAKADIKGVIADQSAAASQEAKQRAESTAKILAELKKVQDAQQVMVNPTLPAVMLPPPIAAPPPAVQSSPPPAPEAPNLEQQPAMVQIPLTDRNNDIWVEPRATVGIRTAPIKKVKWEQFPFVPGKRPIVVAGKYFDGKRVGLSGGPLVNAVLIYNNGRGNREIVIDTRNKSFDVLGADKVAFYSDSASFSVWISN